MPSRAETPGGIRVIGVPGRRSPAIDTASDEPIAAFAGRIEHRQPTINVRAAAVRYPLNHRARSHGKRAAQKVAVGADSEEPTSGPGVNGNSVARDRRQRLPEDLDTLGDLGGGDVQWRNPAHDLVALSAGQHE